MKRGSALLVVLGMLAFMLFSGLAFSVYMRQSRLPTSFLRRTVTTRQLAKAALAEAIEDIDTAIGNDPHPNLHVGTYQSGSVSNIWDHRVFVGAGTTSQQNGNSRNANAQNTYPALVDPSETVPTLPLEGLAYLPPNLINEARYYSQRTPTAKWHSFWFDSGRYAYTAIDVSDYFDINRIYASKKPRSSGNRISLAHLFENISVSGNDDGLTVDHTGAGAGADKWDSFMENFRVDSSDLPLVSLAHFNVEWNRKGGFDFGGDNMISPFSAFLTDGNAYNVGETGSAMERYRMMTFVTDGWFPTTTGNTTSGTNREKIDLATSQPFVDSELNGSSAPRLADVMSFGGEAADERLQHHLCRLGRAQLWDYLDANRVPVSLAMPTLERVPMIVGIEPTLPTIKFITEQPAESSENETATTRTAVRKYVCKMQLDGTVAARVLAAYPFRDHGIADSESFSIDGRIAVFLTLDGQNMALRPGDANEALHLKKEKMDKDNNELSENKTVFSFKLKNPGTVTGTSIAQSGSEPVKSLGLMGSTDGIGEVPFFQVTVRWPQTREDERSGWTPSFEASQEKTFSENASETFASFYALNEDGSKSSTFSDAAAFAEGIANGIKVKANAAVWVRVKYDDPDMGSSTVDLVPACLMDDDEFNKAENGGDSTMLQRFAGKAYPLIRYDVQMDGQPDLTVNYTLNSECPLTIANPKIVVSDPRFNHMPENWRAPGGTSISEQDWISETANLVGKAGYDSDLFMSTSDAGYMQSVYELAFIPRFTSLAYNGSTSVQGDYSPDFTNRSLDDPVSDSNTKFMWTTYRCYDSIAGVADPFDEIGLTYGENGPKVNPYSDSTKVLMAAFANTPHDWRVAATNQEYAVVSESEMKDAAAFNKKYAWNAYPESKKDKMCWDCLEEFAEAFREKMKAATSPDDWEDLYRNLGWSSEQTKFLTSTGEFDSDDGDNGKIYSVDKKFLYGFWHDSFSVRQQLFLIFVRAEPMMMGGGLSGQVPPQLSARAVALVWRDPTATDQRQGSTSLDNPHRTRILFYHQFD